MDKGKLYSEIQMIYNRVTKLEVSHGLDDFEKEHIVAIKELLKNLLES